MKTEQIEYSHAGTTLEAFIAYDEAKKQKQAAVVDDTKKEKLPAVLIFHAWRGRDDFVCDKAKWLTQLGYVGCALDIYGKGVLGSGPEENAKLMEPFMKDRNFLRSRMQAGLKVVQDHPLVDTSRLGAIGFCFGGLCVLDLARSGAPLKGVVSFHGLLMGAEGIKNEPIQSKVLALHGHDDPMVPPEQVLEFEKEMTEAGVDWQLHAYGQTVHAFTNPAANNPEMGTVYSPVSEKRSLHAMYNFFKEVL